MRLPSAQYGRLFTFWCLFPLFAWCWSARAATFSDTCPNSKDIFSLSLQNRSMKSSWQRDYPMLIFDEAAYQAVKAVRDATATERQAQSDADAKQNAVKEAQTALDAKPGDAALQKKVADAQADAQDAMDELDQAKEALTAAEKNARRFPTTYLYWKEANSDDLSALPNNSFVAKVYLTEKVLVLVCNAKFGDGSAINQTSVAASGTETEEFKLVLATAPAVPGASIDRIYALEQKITGNAITVVNFTQTGPANAVDPVANVIVERHQRIRFSAGGGMLLTFATPTNYSIASVPATVTTTTSTTTVTTSSTGTTTTNTTTPVATNSTAEYVLGTQGDSPQLNGVAGLTFYPFGHDTFPVAGRRFTTNYAFYRPYQDIGLFVGTSVSSLGNFAVVPAFEVYPGIQLFLGPTWWSKTSLQPNITACSGYGTSPSFQWQPTETTMSTSTTTGSSPSTTTTTTTVSATATSGCANGDKASILAGSAVPTQNSLQRSWGFGFVFNTNLFKAFSGLSK